MRPVSRRGNRFIRQTDRRRRGIFRDILFESLERRELMAVDSGPRLLSISTNAGSILDGNQTGTTANILQESPKEIVFRFDGAQSIDLTSLNGIRIQREGNVDQNFSTGTPITVAPSYLGFGETERIVIARFAEPLPDDFYRIEVLGFGTATPVRNSDGDALHPRSGDRDTFFVNLELGAKIVAVVPQPTVRIVDPANSARTIIEQRLDQVDVYFNDDDLLKTSAEHPGFYQLILTRDSANASDDAVFTPQTVSYDAVLDKAVLTFASNLDQLAGGAGTFRLRIGSNQSPIPVGPIVSPIGSDVADNLDAASISNRLGTLAGDVSHIINEQVVATQNNRLGADFPGSDFDPGSRDIQDERHLRLTGDTSPYTAKRYYSFLLDQPYAQDSQGRFVSTAISEVQKQRVREVFEFYSSYLGIQFVETTGLVDPDGAPTLQVVVGDLLNGIIGTPGGPGDFVTRTANDFNGQPSLAILDGAELWDNDFGYGTQADNLVNNSVDPTLLSNPLMIEAGRSTLLSEILDSPLNLVGPNFFIEAMRTIGSMLGLGQTHDLPPGTIMGFEPLLGRVENPLEQIFPGDHDIVHGQHLFRPDNRDVDIYRFSIPAGQRGTIAAQAIAEGLADSSSLDTYLKLYKRNASGVVQLISSNDNYFSKDSLIRLDLAGEIGTEFFLAVTSRGNENFDPAISGSGGGGLSDGRYQLRVDYRQAPSASIQDTNGTSIDGDGDGLAGGEFNYWFRVASPIGVAAAGSPRTIFVDKDNTSPLLPGVAPLGSLRNAYSRVQDAFTAAQPGDIVRIIGSAGVDRDLSTINDNLAFEIGDGGPSFGILSDGRDLNVPRGVSLMIDAGAIFKMVSSAIVVGSDGSTSDRSGSSIQVLGTPATNVFFTSFLDESLGRDTNPLNTTPQRGNWGGIEIRNDVAREQGRSDLELSGIFLNYIAMADFRYGGGSVGQGSLARVVNPIQLSSARPTIIGNRISLSADAGISADPNSFEETLFTEARYQFSGSFTPDYLRVGPVIRGNRVFDSTTNGLFIRIDTLAGQPLKTLDVPARLDDTDIVYVLGENLVVSGTPGGSILETVRPNLTSVSFTALSGGTLTSGQAYSYRMVYVDRFGHEGLVSNPTGSVTPSGSNLTVRLAGLPAANTDFVRRRLYRSNPTTAGTWDLVAELDRNSTSYIDSGSALTRAISINPSSSSSVHRARPDASLLIDAGVVLKSQGARIEVGINAQLIAEGTANKPIIFTSRLDDRYGAGATFDTNNDLLASLPAPGDWSGILGLHLSTVSIDSAVISFGGGSSRVAGGFASFNAIELHQSDARIVNSTIEQNASGAAAPSSTRRASRGVNDAAVIYVSGSQPIIVNNVIRDNNLVISNLITQTLQNGETAAISIDANSLAAVPKLDYGRSTGMVNSIDTGTGNLGPLVSGNRLGGNAVNGMRVRGATLTTETVWDDTDIVHVVQNEIVVPDFHTYGGLRLQSKSDESLVVKLAGATAGFTATGRPLDISDRIGGSLQILGSSGFPVVLTALSDDTVGAGFTPDGRSSVDTNNDGNAPVVVLLPTGPEVDRGILIDNDVAQAIPGFFTFQPTAGGESVSSGITAQGRNQLLVNQDVIFDFLNMVDVGSDGTALSLSATTITLPPTLVSPDLVASEGNFVGNGGAIVNWRVESRFDNGIAQLFNTLTFTSASPLGNIRYINYLDEDVASPSDDILFTRGTPGQDDFRIFTVDGAERIGFSQGGVYNQGPGLQNATYAGWAADRFPLLSSALQGAGTQYTQVGNINTTNLPLFSDPALGAAFGPSDVTTALAWDLDPTATTATITTFLELLPREVRTTAAAGSWRGIVLDAYGNDRNVDTLSEREPDQLASGGINNIPVLAQDIGTLSSNIESGDENVRLGVTLSGAIANPSDIDVYRFTAIVGSMVWFDIDRTSSNLDTVLELVDENGKIIALSDNSFSESLSGAVAFYDPVAVTDDRIYTLDQSAFSKSNINTPSVQVDFQGTNPLDAGFRIALPGTPGTTSAFTVRVRSSNVRPTDANPVARLSDTGFVSNGLTSGAYRLQLRQQQTDEIGGSAVRFSDIRFATRGIEVRGGPLHSPLLGELAQPDYQEIDILPNFAGQSSNLSLGNLFNYDRGAVSIAGNLANQPDVDWYRFSVNRELSSNLSSLKHQSVVFDIDYADGLGRPDTNLWVFTAAPNGDPTRLVLVGRDSDITDDKAAPGRGADTSDITRGSLGSGDAFIGAAELPTGNYVVAVTNNSLSANLLEQYIASDAADPLARLEPLDLIQRIAEDRFSGVQVSTLLPPVQEAFPNAPTGSATNIYPNAVPFTLADVAALVARDNPAAGAPRTQLLYANAMTAAKEAEGGTRAGGGIFAQRIRDITTSPGGLLVGPAFAPTTGRTDDATAGRFSQLNSDGTATATPNTTSNIQTIEIVQTGATAFTSRQVRQGNADVGIGMDFTALKFADDANNNLVLFGVAQRGADEFAGQPFDEAIIIPAAGGGTTTVGISPGTGVARNILYLLNADTQDAISPPGGNLGDRGGDSRSTGTGTNTREYGIFADIDTSATHYVRRTNGFADTIIVRREANSDIVGISEIGNFIYGITDQGELWRMTETSFTNGFRGAELIATNLPVGLTGLSKGPRNLTIDSPKSEFILDMPFRIDGGTFRLSFGGDQTVDLPYNATSAQIQAALESLTSVGGVGNIRVTGGPMPESPVAISLIGALAEDPRAINFVATPANPLSITPYASIVRPDTFSDFYRLKIPTETTGGTYRLQYNVGASSEFTTPLAFNATFVEIQNAILAIPSIAMANVTTPGAITAVVRLTAQGVFDITLGGTGLPSSATLSLDVAQATSLVSTRPAPATTVARQTISQYSSILFGIAPNGTLHAFDVNGIPQNIFTDGKSSVISDFSINGFEDSLSIDGALGTDVQGIDFAALDVNLWHVTSARNTDQGHGTLQNFNVSRINSVNAGNSLYFGIRPNNSSNGRQSGNWGGIFDLAGAANSPLNQTYNVPGGAHGAVESNPINLSGYTPDDQPTLYFNYFLDTQNSNSSTTDNNNMQDAFRVYGYSPDGRWVLLGTNNSTNNTDTGLLNQFTGIVDEFDVPISGYEDQFNRSFRTQELFDQSATVTTWRQARINLAPLAGMQDARLRFEFSTGGDFRTGDPLRGGIELTAVAGDRISFGDTFTLIPSADDPFNPVPPTPITFRFDVDGSLPPAPNVILVDAVMTAQDVRDAVRLALARVFNGDNAGDENVTPYPVYQNTVRVYNYLVVDSGPLQATTNRTADKLGAYSAIFPGQDPITGEFVNGDLQGFKDFQRAFRATQANAFEGVYIDDIIVGFAERGEQVFLAPNAGTTIFTDTPFYEKFGGPDGSAATRTEVGAYQLEIRLGAEYADQGAIFPVQLERTFDTNERLSNQLAIMVSPNSDVVDRDTFVIDDGYTRLTFEFDIRNQLTDPATVVQGNIPVPLVLPYLSAKANSGVVATAIRDAINSETAQGLLRVTAGLRGQIIGPQNIDLHKDASNIVELFNRADSLPVGLVTSTGAALQNEFIPNPLDPFGVFPTLFPPIQVAGIYVYGKDTRFGQNPFGEDLGDSSRYRDQGQLVISSNSISDSSEFGIVIDAGATVRTDLTRNPLTARPLPGAVRNLITLNTQNLAPGVVIVNNVLSRGGGGGLSISGAGNATAGGLPPFTIARVINNTIYGSETPSGTGIVINQGASPTLINNILANNFIGIDGGASTIAGGNLFSENNTNITAATPSGTFDIVLNPGEPIFGDVTNGKFYLSAQSRAIDSSLGSLQERPGLTSVKSGIGRLPNPMIAPDRDVGGLLRQDDPLVNTPAGQGQNVFIDRGAVDRSDFVGPSAFIQRPLDNDSNGADIDSNSTFIKLVSTSPALDFFEILLDETQGTGADPESVTARSILVTENGRLLVEGLDYVFGYSINSRTIRLTPLSGFWRRDSVYEVTLNNRTRLMIDAAQGDTLVDGTQLTATLSSGTSLVFEYESGFAVQVPQTYRLQIPSLGSNPGGLADGQTFSIALSTTSITFELTTDSSVLPNNLPVPIPANASATVVRDAILSVLQSTSVAGVLQLSPKAVGSDQIHLGTGVDHTVSTGTSGLVLSGAPSGVTDGQIFTYQVGANAPVVFEFNLPQNTVASTNIEIPILATDTNDDIGAKIATALAAVVTGGSSPVRHVGQGIVHVGGQVGDSLVVTNSSLNLLGAPGVQVGAIAVPFVPAGSFTAELVAGSLIQSINSLPKPQFQSVRANSFGQTSILAEGISSITNIVNTSLDPIIDLAGNSLVPNRSNGFTQFTIAMPDTVIDFGDALPLNAPTLSANNGARHAQFPVDVARLVLGSVVDTESDGFPSVGSTGDDVNGTTDDEDGVAFSGFFNSNSPPVSISIQVNGVGFLDAWIDWNGDGDFLDTQEKIINSQNVDTRLYRFSISTPQSPIANPGDHAARFRLSSTGGLFPNGMAVGGEVEDYTIKVIAGIPPVANDDRDSSYVIDEDAVNPLVVSAPGILANDTDADAGQTLSVFDSDPNLAGTQPVSGTNNGALTLNPDGSFSYVPNANFSGTDAFVYLAQDSLGLGSIQPATVTITVNAVNDAPVFSLGKTLVTVNEDLDATGSPDAIPYVAFATGIRSGPAGSTSEDSQTLTFNLAATNPSFFSIQPAITSDGTLTFTLAPDGNRTFVNGLDNRVVVTLVDDGLGNSPNVNTSAPVTFTVDIAPINDPPSLDGYREIVVEDSTTTFTALSVLVGDLPGPATATDEQNQVVTMLSMDSVSANGGTITPVMNGATVNTFNYTPAPNFVGTDTFTYVVSDNVGTFPLTSVGTVTITITAVNDAPVFTIPASLDVSEDQGSILGTGGQVQVPVSIAAFATGVSPGPTGSGDESGQTITFDVVALEPSFYEVQPTLVTNPSNVSEAILSFTLAPNRNRNFLNGLSNRIQVIARDNGSSVEPNVNSSATIIFAVNIIPINDPPIPGNFQPSVVEDFATNFTATQLLSVAKPGPAEAVDETSQSLTITQIAQRSSFGGVINPVVNAGVIDSFRYIPPANFVGTDTITYTITDNDSSPLSTVGTMTVTVTAVNDAPEFSVGPDVVVLEDAAAYSQQWVPLNNSVPPGPAILAGPINATDELTGAQSQTVQFTVTTTNSALFSVAPAISPTGVLTFTAAKDANGVAFLSVTAIDNGSGAAPDINRSQTITFAITLTSVNDEPVFTAGSTITINEDSGAFNQSWATGIQPAAGLASAPTSASDESGQTISFVFLSNSNPGLFTVGPAIAADGKLNFTPALNQFGTAIVSVVARDNGLTTSPNDHESIASTFTINILPLNDPPAGSPDGFTTTEDEILPKSGASISLSSNDSDPDGDTFTVIAGNTTSGRGATVLLRSDGSFEYDPRLATSLQALQAGQSFADTFTYRLQDSLGTQSLPITVTVTVDGLDDNPTTVDDAFSVPPDTTTNLNVLQNDTDPDSTFNLSTLQLGILPVNGTAAVLSNGQFSYTPNAGFRGSDNFTYRISDSTGLISNEATVTVRVNRPPLALADSATALTNASVVIDVLLNDSDPDGNSTINRSSVSITVPASSGTATVQNNGTILFTPSTGFTGSASFRYTIADTSQPPAVSDSALVTVNVVASLYQNPNSRFDVNNDGFVSPVDALIIINDIQRRGSRILSPGEFTPPPFIDVDGSGSVEPIDVLQVINFLNRRTISSGGEGESNRSDAMATPALATSAVSSYIDVLMVTPEQRLAAVVRQVIENVPRSAIEEAIEEAWRLETEFDESVVNSLAGGSNLRNRGLQTDAAFANSFSNPWET